MIVAETIADVRLAVAEARAKGKSLALVPTMGKLHAGHYSLIEAARRAADYVVVSIFVNPTQFAPSEDLDSYPRSPKADKGGCEARSVDLVFMPSVETMYGRGALTTINVPKLSQTLCGRNRRQHFAGVCTVVTKLFNIVQPDKAFFGAKDYQQAAIIKRMVTDLNFPVEIVVCPTVRHVDGLAMSSRNDYLSADQRRQATGLYSSLQLAVELLRSSRPLPEQVIEAMRKHLAGTMPDGEVEYIQMVDPYDLTDVATTDRPLIIALAVRLGPARLIDNVLVD